ncbi:MAG: Sapep family Mn(2+)-dependent dipeptidase, partial [Firmicutes bacterium]|nr:Sapep family Mn(2+)-dependent dipeptidase [Bacillota bacterium]
GEGPIIGIYSHADVVPVSGQWRFPPFIGTIADGKMFGRGTSDDKGPGMAAFYALKALKDNHLIQGFQIRHVVGGNEEKGSRCLDYYFHKLHRPYPKYGFTPDAEFPLIYGEKGITNYLTSGPVDLAPVLSIEAGVVVNSVIDIAKAKLVKDPSIENVLRAKGYKFEVSHDDQYTYVTMRGQAAHGSVPEKGVNAGLQLLAVLGEHYHLKALSQLAALYADPSGKSLHEFYETELLHATTYNVGLISYDGHEFSLVVNFRYPETVDPLIVIPRIADKSPLSTKILSTAPSLLVDPKSAMIQTLLKVYQTETGDMKTPIMAIGGGTYAKEAKNTVAFGSNFPGKDDHIHEANEKIDLEDFYKSMPIYAHAIHALGKMK